MKKHAFTLAEVLITLGIIGIVAAMTLPQLMSGYRKRMVSTKLKKTVSMLQQVVLRSSIDNGPPDTLGLGNWDYEFFNTYYAPYMDLMKICEFGVDDPKDQCNTAIYFSNDINTAYTYNKKTKKYILNNGIAILFRPGGTLNTGKRRGVFTIITENNKKLIYGKNAFNFNLIVHDNKKYYITSSQDYSTVINFCDKKEISEAEMLRDCKFSNSNPHGFAAAIYCSALIECNGWEVPKNYPINL